VYGELDDFSAFRIVDGYAGNLRRQIGLRTATALIVGEIIAVGIFLTPAAWRNRWVRPFAVAVWLVVGAIRCAAALSLENAVRPEAGGGYRTSRGL